MNIIYRSIVSNVRIISSTSELAIPTRGIVFHEPTLVHVKLEQVARDDLHHRVCSRGRPVLSLYLDGILPGVEDVERQERLSKSRAATESIHQSREQHL